MEELPGEELELIHTEFENYYGSFDITKIKHDGKIKYFAAVENWDGYSWREIPEYLYEAVKKFTKDCTHSSPVLQLSHCIERGDNETT